MKIRKVNKEDFNSIYKLVEEAFKTAQVSDGTEQDFVLNLRKGKNYIPELELVAEEKGELIGHIMFTKQKIQSEDSEFTGLLVAPLCVRIDYRSKRLGEMLMQYGFEEAKKLGYTACFLEGNPNYYERFGYKKIIDYGIQNDTGVPDEFVMACEIIPGALKEVKGKIKI